MVPRSGAGAGVPEGVVADGPRLAQAATKEQSRIVGKVRFTNFNWVYAEICGRMLTEK